MKSRFSSEGFLIAVVVVLAVAISVATYSVLGDLPFAARLALYSVASLLLFAVVYRLMKALRSGAAPKRPTG